MLKDLTNSRFGRLVVLRRSANNKRGDAFWECVCDCGKEKVIMGRSLRIGATRSCGCMLSQRSKERMTLLLTKHGKSDSKIYRVWNSIKERCLNPPCKSFKNYGGRGISVCDAWFKFDTFYSWAISSGYKEGLEIDRVNVDGNYEPNNCRWVTAKINTQNTRRCRSVMAYDPNELFIGEFGSCNDAAKACNVGSSSVERVCKNKQPHIKGYKFKFKEETKWS